MFYFKESLKLVSEFEDLKEIYFSIVNSKEDDSLKNTRLVQLFDHIFYAFEKIGTIDDILGIIEKHTFAVLGRISIYYTENTDYFSKNFTSSTKSGHIRLNNSSL